MMILQGPPSPSCLIHGEAARMASRTENLWGGPGPVLSLPPLQASVSPSASHSSQGILPASHGPGPTRLQVAQAILLPQASSSSLAHPQQARKPHIQPAVPGGSWPVTGLGPAALTCVAPAVSLQPHALHLFRARQLGGERGGACD